MVSIDQMKENNIFDNQRFNLKLRYNGMCTGIFVTENVTKNKLTFNFFVIEFSTMLFIPSDENLFFRDLDRIRQRVIVITDVPIPRDLHLFSCSLVPKSCTLSFFLSILFCAYRH